MKAILLSILLALLLQGCKNLPAAGWFEKTGSGERVYVLFVGEEADVVSKYPGVFTKQDFIIAMGRSPSSQYLSAGRPHYYTVITDSPEHTANLQIITLEILERDYHRSQPL